MLLLLLCMPFIGSSATNNNNDSLCTPGRCLSYKIFDKGVVFYCENNITSSIQLFGGGIVKVMFTQNDSTFSDKSFAVTKEAQQSIKKIHVSEQPQKYEIFTDKLIVRIQKEPFSIHFYDKYQKLLLGDYQDRGFSQKGKEIASYKTLRHNEQFFGLGEKTGSINRRGKSFRMWNSDKPCYGGNEDPLYKSIPFFMSNYGYGIFFDNTHKADFKMGSESNDFFSFEAPDGEMVYYFIYGPTYKQIIKRYVQLTGKPIMPPSWALGFSQCRGMLTNEKLTREIASEFRKRKIPCDVIYQDIGWTENLQDFQWRKDNYLDPVKMLSDLEDKGFKVIVSQDPVVSQSNKEQWSEADSLGYFTRDVRTGKSYDMPWPWGGNCGVVDFTNPAVANWWGKYQQKAIDDGVRGFWTDMGEPAWSNEENTDRLFMQHNKGMHSEIHNVYGLTWDRVVTQQFEKRNPNTRIFQMTRAGYAGMQRYTFGWSGDSGNGNNVLEGWSNLQGQLPLAMSAGLGLIPFWTCDISGYCGDITDHQAMGELYARWIQFGVFNPLSRAHHEGNNAAEPWRFGPQVEKICRNAIEFKYKLFPYIYSYAREAYDTGLPLIRPLVLEYSQNVETYNLNSQFLFGKELLVAPVVEQGASSVDVYLPKGDWIDFSDGLTRYKGKKWISYPVSLESIPVFVKSGSIIPSMPVSQYIGEHPNYPLILDVFPAGINHKASFTVYEDDGESNDYKRDICGKREIVCSTHANGYDISTDMQILNGFVPMERTKIFYVHCNQKPKRVFLDAKKMKTFRYNDSLIPTFTSVEKTRWAWDAKRKVCVVVIPTQSLFSKISIVK